MSPLHFGNLLLLQKFASDSTTEYRLEEDGDILVVTSTIGEVRATMVTTMVAQVVAWRRLRRQEGGRDQGAGARRHSIC